MYNLRTSFSYVVWLGSDISGRANGRLVGVTDAGADEDVGGVTVASNATDDEEKEQADVLAIPV